MLISLLVKYIFFKNFEDMSGGEIEENDGINSAGKTDGTNNDANNDEEKKKKTAEEEEISRKKDNYILALKEKLEDKTIEIIKLKENFNNKKELEHKENEENESNHINLIENQLILLREKLNDEKKKTHELESFLKSKNFLGDTNNLQENDINNILDKLINSKLKINKLEEDKLIRNKKEEIDSVNDSVITQIEQLQKKLYNKDINMTGKNQIISTLNDQIKELKQKLIILENKLDKDKNDEEELKFLKDEINKLTNENNKLIENIRLRDNIIKENKIFKTKMEEINKMNLVKTYELLFCILEKLYKISSNKNKMIDPLTKLNLLNKKVSNIKQTINSSDEIAYLKKEDYNKYLSFKTIFRSLLEELKKKMEETKKSLTIKK